MATKAQLLQKLHLFRKNPELYGDISNAELSELVLTVMNAVEVIDKAIQEGRLDGRTPVADEDYLSVKTAKKEITEIFSKIAEQYNKDIDAKASTLEQRVDKAIAGIKNGEDAFVSDGEIERAAQIAYEMIEMPDFDALIEEKITASPETVRNGLEILKDKDKLEMGAIQGLLEELQAIRQLAQQNNRPLGSYNGIGTNTVNSVIDQRVAAGDLGGGVNVETPSGTINGTNKEFTVSNEPKYVVVNAFTYFAGAGYSYSGGTITFDDAPVTNSTIRSIY